ncbi:hypothetical protein PR202_ga13450 [Eleusine coracana subsp. coracana]|uniref:phosphoribosylamine--glycine ligase n=1 Tax=Eleusine coracana subsp. coracana TaxID=191504 RepID=A0AAV5CES5_ELECO|nr:hypothetical protein PR202_ga13450 [Eleusine coracana subsp. coracana]
MACAACTVRGTLKLAVASVRWRSSLEASATDAGIVSGEKIIILVIGGGGREHALCYALNRSPSCSSVLCAPGNAGISQSRDATCISDLDISNSNAVISFCRTRGVGMIVVGPEAPLVAGLSNDLVKAGIPTFGPSSEAAALEGSKDFMKKLCDKYNIPTAKYCTFMDAVEAKEYVKQQGAPIVVKADGLAAGKGVVVAMTLDEAFEAIDSMLVQGSFGSAGSRVIIEEFLEGEEASFFALVDGENALPLESAQDHKRVGDGDVGPNTGGMGAYSPAPIVTEELKGIVMESIIVPTVKGMAAEGCKFVGVLYAGLMIEKKSGLPKLIEYNVRFGDPECQTGGTPSGRAESGPENELLAQAQAVVAERPPAPVLATPDACRPAPARRSGQRNPEAPAAQEVVMVPCVARAKTPVLRVARAKTPVPRMARKKASVPRVAR